MPAPTYLAFQTLYGFEENFTQIHTEKYQLKKYLLRMLYIKLAVHNFILQFFSLLPLISMLTLTLKLSVSSKGFQKIKV